MWVGIRDLGKGLVLLYSGMRDEEGLPVLPTVSKKGRLRRANGDDVRRASDVRKASGGKSSVL